MSASSYRVPAERWGGGSLDNIVPQGRSGAAGKLPFFKTFLG